MKWIVQSDDHGLTLRKFLRNKLPSSFSSRQINQSIESGFCEVNFRIELFGSTLLKKGDTILFDEKQEIDSPNFLFEPERVLFEDEFILAYNKPSGISSDQQNGLHELLCTCGSLYLIHRLDKMTTGVILFAKTLKIQKILEQVFRLRKVKKTYLAVVDGIPGKAQGVIEKKIGEISRSDEKIIRGVNKHGVYAKTVWSLLGSGNQASLIECFPYTGRTHQIRIHLASIGLPIVGDYEYHRQFHCQFRPPRYLLHSYELYFNHPVKTQPLRISAQMPNDIKTALQILNIY